MIQWYLKVCDSWGLSVSSRCLSVPGCPPAPINTVGLCGTGAPFTRTLHPARRPSDHVAAPGSRPTDNFASCCLVDDVATDGLFALAAIALFTLTYYFQLALLPIRTFLSGVSLPASLLSHLQIDATSTNIYFLCGTDL